MDAGLPPGDHTVSGTIDDVNYFDSTQYDSLRCTLLSLCSVLCVEFNGDGTLLTTVGTEMCAGSKHVLQTAILIWDVQVTYMLIYIL